MLDKKGSIIENSMKENIISCFIILPGTVSVHIIIIIIIIIKATLRIDQNTCCSFNLTTNFSAYLSGYPCSY